MSLSLRDQLLQAGLISKKQAEKAQAATGKDKPRGQHNHGKPVVAQAPNAEALKAAEAARQAKAAKDRELMEKAKEKQALKAKYAEIKQLVEANKLPPVASEMLYNFTDRKNNIRRIPVTPELRAQIISLSIWVGKYTSMVIRGEDDIDALIDINRIIMQGLGGGAVQAA